MHIHKKKFAGEAPLSERIFSKMLAARLVVLAWSVALILVTGFSLPSLTRDTTSDAFIDPDEPALAYKERVENLFGLTDPIVIAVMDRDEDGIFDADTLALVETLTREVERLPEIDPDRVTSLATENNIVGVADGMITEGFMDPDTNYFESQPGTAARAAEIRSAIAEFPLYQGSLVARDGTATLVIAELIDDDLGETAYSKILDLTRSIEAPEGVEIHVAGEGAVSGYLSTYIDQDARRLNPVAALIITTVLFLAFLSARAAFLPNIIVLGTVIGSFGLMAASGTSFYVITNGLVVNLIGIAVADSIHILSEYFSTRRDDKELSPRKVVTKAMSKMWRPVTLTSITTIAGFLALAASTTMPPVRSFGLFGALGVALAWVYSMTLLPALLSLWPSSRLPYPFRRNETRNTANLSERALRVFGRNILTHPRTVIGLTILVLMVGVFGASKVVVDEARIETFKPTEPIYQADKAINDVMDGAYYLDILVETEEPGGLYDPAVLRKIESLQEFLQTLPAVNGSTSIVDYVKQLNKSVNEGREAYYAIPDDPQLIAQLFFLYGASADPTDFEEEVDYDYQRALVRANVSNDAYTNNKIIVPALEEYIATSFNGDGLQGTVTGRVAVNYAWIDGIASSNLLSVALSFIAVVLTAMILFRSFVAGMIAAAPVGMAVLLVYAVMGYFSIPLGVGTSMFAAIAIGLSIDFAIHALDRIREIGRSRGLTPDTLVELYPSTGRALLFNFIAVAGGFGVLTTSDVPPLIKFGALVAVAVSIAFLASMTALPALVALLRPRALCSPVQEDYQNVPPFQKTV